MSRLNTKELSSRFYDLTHDLHLKACKLNEVLQTIDPVDVLSKIDPSIALVKEPPAVRKVIELIALNHRLIAAGTEMVNEGVEGGVPKGP